MTIKEDGPSTDTRAQAGIAAGAAAAHGTAAAVKVVAGAAHASLGRLGPRVNSWPRLDSLTEAIENANATANDVRALANLLRHAVEHGIAPSEAAAHIRHQQPVFGQVGVWLNSNQGLLTLVAVIVAVLALLNDRAMNAEPAESPSINITIDTTDRQEIERLVEEKLRELEAAREQHDGATVPAPRCSPSGPRRTP
ncbi:hypothetical protein [Pseudonocardia sp.]|uniref:hypothetical protein n=1 Tax=Pseudonocardia sp. TaxID=60912 RepID=UPI003D109E81